MGVSGGRSTPHCVKKNGGRQPSGRQFPQRLIPQRYRAAPGNLRARSAMRPSELPKRVFGSTDVVAAAGPIVIDTSHTMGDAVANCDSHGIAESSMGSANWALAGACNFHVDCWWEVGLFEYQ